jgi:hypothetical protein
MDNILKEKEIIELLEKIDNYKKKIYLKKIKKILRKIDKNTIDKNTLENIMEYDNQLSIDNQIIIIPQGVFLRISFNEFPYNEEDEINIDFEISLLTILGKELFKNMFSKELYRYIHFNELVEIYDLNYKLNLPKIKLDYEIFEILEKINDYVKYVKINYNYTNIKSRFKLENKIYLSSGIFDIEIEVYKNLDENKELLKELKQYDIRIDIDIE